MVKLEQFEFRIQAFSPKTFPMSKLAEYMADLATLLGDNARVHFVKLKEGSTALVHSIEAEAVPMAIHRARQANSQDAPADIKAAAQRLLTRLQSDGAKGASLKHSSGEKIFEFRPSRTVEQPTISEAGYVQGQVIKLGGPGEWVPVHLEDVDGTTYICEAKRDKSKELSHYYLNGIVRASGTGKWTRLEQGGWSLDRFRIREFEVVNADDFAESIEKLRSMSGKWKDEQDPLTALEAIRNGA